MGGEGVGVGGWGGGGVEEKSVVMRFGRQQQQPILCLQLQNCTVPGSKIITGECKSLLTYRFVVHELGYV